MASQLDKDTALTPLGDDRYAGSVSHDWWVQSGPNGGYLSAMALRAVLMSCDDPERRPRSLHVRFLAAPGEGPVELQVETVRAGRRLSTFGVQMHQEGKTVLSAGATLGSAFSAVGFQDAPMPEVRPRADCEPLPKQIPLNQRWDMWRGIGGEVRKSPRALTGGWIRPADPRPADYLLLAAMWDAWPPSAFARAMEDRFKGAAPTVEASVYFMASLPLPDARDDDCYIIRVEAQTVSEGFMDEAGEIWTADGLLLARSRQLQLLI